MEDAYEREVRKRAEREGRGRLVLATLQLAVGGVLAVGCGVATFFVDPQDKVVFGLLAALGVAILMAFPSRRSGWLRIFNYLGYHRKSWTRPGTVARANAFYEDVKSYEGDSTARLKRRLLWVNMSRIGITIAMLGLWVVNDFVIKGMG